MLNVALEKLRCVLPAFPDETKLTKIETLRQEFFLLSFFAFDYLDNFSIFRFANHYIWAMIESVNAIEKGGRPPFPPHPGLADELRKSIERGDGESVGKNLKSLALSYFLST